MKVYESKLKLMHKLGPGLASFGFDRQPGVYRQLGDFENYPIVILMK